MANLIEVRTPKLPPTLDENSGIKTNATNWGVANSATFCSQAFRPPAQRNWQSAWIETRRWWWHHHSDVKWDERHPNCQKCYNATANTLKDRVGNILPLITWTHPPKPRYFRQSGVNDLNSRLLRGRSLNWSVLTYRHQKPQKRVT